MNESSEHTDSISHQGLPEPRRKVAVLVILLGLGMSILSGSMINLALPEIAIYFNQSHSDVIWVVSSYQMAALAALLPCSALGDRFGYRRIYIIGVALFTLGALFCALSETLESVIFMRVLQGIGSAGIMGVNIALMRQIYPEFLLGRGIALNGIVVSLCAISGPFVAAQILTFANWRWILGLTLPVGAFLFFLARIGLPVIDARNGEDGNSCEIVSISDIVLSMLIFGVFFLLANHWRLYTMQSVCSLFFWLLIIFFCVLCAWFALRQKHLPSALFPMDLLRNRDFVISITMTTAAYCAQALFFLSLPFLLLNVWGGSEVQSGLLIAVWPLSMALVSLPVGRLIGGVSDVRLSLLGLFVLASGLGLFLFVEAGDWQYLFAGICMVLSGIGFCLFHTPNIHSIISAAPVKRSGAASGLMSVARLTGQIFAAVLVSTIFSAWDSLPAAIWVVQLTALLCALLAIVFGLFKGLRSK